LAVSAKNQQCPLFLELEPKMSPAHGSTARLCPTTPEKAHSNFNSGKGRGREGEGERAKEMEGKFLVTLRAR
jgi:hypothetical protein